ncbi:hypothetical protein ZEAMMB73_Zm00001d026411 [Zea mays]|uniref:Uncharacterized protein n=1 Tax=Zea mays TaxID=4577 RepID=A0A1D6JFF5_MAIZE|nr:hypothetical protein ZEAMMB73_Zm00001d026408 [Zea mays]AQK46512.1 hypothetical protein ZEAMMB73_Zm00001d026411 [Zea mays]
MTGHMLLTLLRRGNIIENWVA